jgi:hypothetical protein
MDDLCWELLILPDNMDPGNLLVRAVRSVGHSLFRTMARLQLMIDTDIFKLKSHILVKYS